MTLRAFSVLEKYEMTGDIFFAEKAIQAAKAGANEYADGELRGVQCRRAPWADEYAGKGVPAKVAVDHGWRFECSGCGITVDSDLEENHRLPVDGIRGKVSGAVFCSSACEAKSKRDEERRQAEIKSAIRDFKEIVKARFPDADFADDESGFGGHHAHVVRDRRKGKWHRAQVVVAFRFPGMKIGYAHFRMDPNHRIGPSNAGYTCCNGDREAFEAYAAATKMKAAQEVVHET